MIRRDVGHGNGNFGVITRFEFKLHPVGPEVLAGLIVFPFAVQPFVEWQKAFDPLLTPGRA